MRKSCISIVSSCSDGNACAPRRVQERSNGAKKMSTATQVPETSPVSKVVPSMAMSATKLMKKAVARPPMSLLDASDDETPLPPALYAL